MEISNRDFGRLMLLKKLCSLIQKIRFERPKPVEVYTPVYDELRGLIFSLHFIKYTASKEKLAPPS